MKLSELHTGERGVIVKTGGHGGFRKRIAEMGFVRGKSVKVLLNAPLLDPIEYEIMGYKISLRREEAALVEVIGESEAENLTGTATETLSPLKPDASDNEEQWQNLQHRMEQMAEQKRRTIRVALVGNPNCGKTSLFNIASGAHEHVGNYSGVTVGVKTGTFRHAGYDITLIDLPGTYSLSAYSPEERFVRQQLTDDAPDVVVNVVDATNLERNLYLTTQLIDMNLRMVVALNMYDEVEKRGDKLDHETLGLLLGVPMVPTQSRGGQGVETLFDTVIAIYNKAIGTPATETAASPEQMPATDEGHACACRHCHGQCLQLHTRHIHVNHGAELEQSINVLKAAFKKNLNLRSKYSTRYLAISFLEGNADVENLVETLPNHDELISLRYAEQRRIKEELNESPEDALVAAKYGFIAGALRETHQPGNGHARRHNRTSRIDSIVTNRYLGFPLFFLVLFLIFQATFVLGEYPMQAIDWLVGQISEFTAANMAEGPLQSLVCDGIIGGVGSVIVFLPNILILYFLISLLEDTGYMARAAFIMDKLMHRVGLHGKSFIPMVMGFGCNVPAVMATRTIENPRSRLVTMLVLPLMSCSARLPVFVVIIGAFFPQHGAWVMTGLYALGILLAALMARVFSSALPAHDNLPFVMELPPYRIPVLKSSLRHMWEKGRQYLRKMGGIILAFSVLVWVADYFPRPAEPEADAPVAEQTAATESYLCRMGRAIEPVFAPLGFDWKMSVGILSGVGAKELVVSTLGVMYADETSGIDTDDEEQIMHHLQKQLLETTTPAAAMAYLVFVLLYFPCIATIVAIRHESGRWKWALLTAVYTTVLAYVCAWITFQLMQL